MEGKEYVERLLDLLVDMANHCEKKDAPVKGKAKCVNCGLSWNFNIRSHGCLLVNMMNNDDLIDDITSVCVANDIDYNKRLNKVASIFVTEYDDE